jgi:benzoyl-CoA 2,3-dioxygenase component B
VPLRNAMNEVLRDAYVRDCQRGVDHWNRTLAQHGITGLELRLPDRRFNRHMGAYGGQRFDPDGKPTAEPEWQGRRSEWLPTPADDDFVRSLMQPVYERGKMASWIAPPTRGINGKPVDFEYVRMG